jgi:uncharacterized protein (DUF983 family)
MSLDIRSLPSSEARPLARSLGRGLICRCPACGEGRLFERFLKVTPRCERCGEEFSPQRADDMPPYLVIFIVGHIVVGLLVAAEKWADWPMWLHMTIWPLLTIVLSLLLLQPMKGAVVGQQWALRMHGFADAKDRQADKRT